MSKLFCVHSLFLTLPAAEGLESEHSHAVEQNTCTRALHRDALGMGTNINTMSYIICFLLKWCSLFLSFMCLFFSIWFLRCPAAVPCGKDISAHSLVIRARMWSLSQERWAWGRNEAWQGWQSFAGHCAYTHPYTYSQLRTILSQLKPPTGRWDVFLF